MGENKLVLIIDESKIFLDKKTDEIIKEWGYNKSSCRTLTSWTRDSGKMISMFDTPYARLDLCEDSDLKSFVELIINRKKNDLFSEDNWYGNGLIITINKNRGTKKIVDLINEFKGLVIQKKTTEEHKKELLSKLDIDNELKEIISDYIGEDYESLYSIINSIGNLEDKSIININNIYTFLPYKPGSVPPWNYINILYTNDVEAAHKELDRVLKNSHPLIVLKLLKNSFNNLYLYNTARSMGYWSIKQAADELGISNKYIFINASKTRRDLKNEVAEYLLNEVCYLEYLIKNGTAIDINELLHVFTSRAMASLIANTTQLYIKRGIEK